MGVPKHGKDSARTKSSKKYKERGMHEVNKRKKAEKIAAGEKVKRRRGLTDTEFAKFNRIMSKMVPIGLNIKNKKKRKKDKDSIPE